MKLLIELKGTEGEPTKKDVQKNIAAQKRAINRKSKPSDHGSLVDTLSILEGIKKQIRN